MLSIKDNKSQLVKLYIKTLDKTGLMYFGKTISKNPDLYKGSGTYWKRHLKKHGGPWSTIILGSFDKDDPMLVEYALGFSAANNIVLSEDWANLIEENGLSGGDIWSQLSPEKQEETKKKKALAYKNLPKEKKEEMNAKRSATLTGKMAGADHPMYGKKHSEESKKKNSDSNMGNIQTEETKKKISETKKGKPFSEEHKRNLRRPKKNAEKVTCPHCNKRGIIGNMVQWHFDRCLQNPLLDENDLMNLIESRKRKRR